MSIQYSCTLSKRDWMLAINYHCHTKGRSSVLHTSRCLYHILRNMSFFATLRLLSMYCPQDRHSVLMMILSQYPATLYPQNTILQRNSHNIPVLQQELIRFHPMSYLAAENLCRPIQRPNRNLPYMVYQSILQPGLWSSYLPLDFGKYRHFLQKHQRNHCYISIL